MTGPNDIMTASCRPVIDDEVFFFSFHTKADEDHAGRQVWEPIERHLTRAEDREDVLDALMLALAALKLFYQGISEFGDELDAR